MCVRKHGNHEHQHRRNQAEPSGSVHILGGSHIKRWKLRKGTLEEGSALQQE